METKMKTQTTSSQQIPGWYVWRWEQRGLSLLTFLKSPSGAFCGLATAEIALVTSVCLKIKLNWILLEAPTLSKQQGNEFVKK